MERPLRNAQRFDVRVTRTSKWVCPGGESRRFKRTDKRFEMTWYDSKQQSLTFSGEEGKEMKNKLKALVSKRLHKGTKNSKAMLQEDSNKIIDNEPSTTSTNEDDCCGQVSSALDILVSKLDNFEQQFKNFQAKTDNDIHILFAKLEMNTDNEKEREIDRLREENCKLKSDNANLIERLNGHANSPKDLSNKLKAVEDEKASLLTAVSFKRLTNPRIRNRNLNQLYA